MTLTTSITNTNNTNTKMKQTYVKKRNGKLEPVSFDKVKWRIECLCKQEPELIEVDSSQISIEVIKRIYNGVTTTELDAQAARICANRVTEHPEYGTLASRLVVSNHQKNTCVRFRVGEDEHTRDRTFAESMDILYLRRDENDDHSPIISKHMRDFAMDNSKQIEKIIDYNRDFNLDFFGFKTLERAYLLKIGKEIIERPQHMWMRVALVVTKYDLNLVSNTYDLLSNGFYTHATPTLFNSGTVLQQLSSCFLIAMKDDSLDGIYNTLWDAAKISKRAGGIGLHLANLRSRGALIRGTNGRSLGLMPVLKLYNSSAELINQGGRRKGSYAMYIEPWHPDIFTFIEAKRGQTGEESSRALDLFYALWIPDRFMRTLEFAILHENETEPQKKELLYEKSQWYLMDPDKCPGLTNVYGEHFDELYNHYIDNNKYNKKIYIMDLWKEIVTSQIESGVPYMLSKDACNKKSNQNNLGTIKSSNLCTEIVEFSSDDETAVCNLCSIAVNQYVDEIPFSGGKKPLECFNHELLLKDMETYVRNMDNVIDVNDYPTIECKNSNMRHRPIGIGIQGLQDAFFMLRIPFDSAEALQLDREIFETIYYGFLRNSCNLAKQYGKYESFDKNGGCPLSKGILQFDMWENFDKTNLSGRYDWDALREDIKQHGVRNSLGLCCMPTASSSQILGNVECIEPIKSNVFKRRTLAGEFVVLNKYLVHDLIDAGLWNYQIKQRIISADGSIQDYPSSVPVSMRDPNSARFPEIPQELKNLYKTVWEMKQKHIVDHAGVNGRGAFIDQSQSMNLFFEKPTAKIITRAHLYTWRQGLKTMSYYIRTRAAASAIKFTVSVQDTQNTDAAHNIQNNGNGNEIGNDEEPELVCYKEDGCWHCSA